MRLDVMITTLALLGTLCWLTAGALSVRAVQERDRLLVTQDAVIADQQAAMATRDLEMTQARALLRAMRDKMVTRN